MKTKLKLLNETIEYYWGIPERKCMNSLERCQYSATETSEGCAIGRLIPHDLSQKLDLKAATVAEIFEELPLEIQEYGLSFLTALQDAHDGNTFVKRDKLRILYLFQDQVDIGQIVFPAETTPIDINIIH